MDIDDFKSLKKKFLRLKNFYYFSNFKYDIIKFNEYYIIIII